MTMKTFNVEVLMSTTYSIEAESEEEARQIALEYWYLERLTDYEPEVSCEEA